MAAKKFKIKFDGIDGVSTDSFAKLADAAKYVKDQWMGDDYIKTSTWFGGEYGQFFLSGFTLHDIGVLGVSAEYQCYEFEFFKEFGGKAVNMKNGDFTVVEFQNCGEHPDVSNVVSCHATAEEAIQDACQLAEENHDCGDTWYHVCKSGVKIGFVDSDSFEYISNEDYGAYKAKQEQDAKAWLKETQGSSEVAPF